MSGNRSLLRGQFPVRGGADESFIYERKQC